MKPLEIALSRTHTFILAGGQGERLGPLTTNRPKPSVSFGGIFRIIDFTLSNCLYSRLRHVSLLTQYRHENLHEYVRQGWSRLWNEVPDPNKSLVCLAPSSGKRYRGTADAVFRNLPILDDTDPEFVLILSGDHIYHMDYGHLLAQHIETNADLTLATVPHPRKDASHFGVVEINGDSKVVGFVEKPATPKAIPSDSEMALVNMGVYVFKTEVLKQQLRTFCDRGCTDFGRDVIPAMIPSHRVVAYEYRDERSRKAKYWRDIGTIESYYRASMDIISSDPLFDPFVNESQPSKPTRHPALNGIAPPPQALVHESAEVKRSVISAGVNIAANVTISDSILMPGVCVGEGVQLRKVIVEEGVEIPAGFRAGFDLAHDRSSYKVTDTGVVVVGKAAHSSPAEPSKSRLRTHLVAATA